MNYLLRLAGVLAIIYLSRAISDSYISGYITGVTAVYFNIIAKHYLKENKETVK